MAGKLAIDHEIAGLARVQHGVLSRAQLLHLGMTRNEVERRVTIGRLHRLHQGVYAVGHTVLTARGRWMAATLATGGVLSHASAAAAWDLVPVGGGAIHVTVPGDVGRARRSGIRVHRSVTLRANDTTTLDGIPITEPHRTLNDLAATTSGRRLEQAVNRAERLVDFGRLQHSAPPFLQAVLSRYATHTTRSELEERFLRLCDAHGIPRPETNTRIEGYEVDFVWREERLIVEVDGYEHHRSPTAFETDRERDVTLTTKGWRVLRFTYDQVTTRAAWVAACLRAGRPRAAGA